MNFFTSDTHFGHSKVIPYCNRPFKDADEMDAELIRRWNTVVSKDDTVYHLGDFAWRGSTFVSSILPQLNGHKILIMGNHDTKFKRHKWERLGFETAIAPYGASVYIKGKPVLMSHFPYKDMQHDDRRFDDYQHENDGRLLLHGHVHCAWKKNGNMINVGVDQWSFAPVSEDEILKLLIGESNEKLQPERT